MQKNYKILTVIVAVIVVAGGAYAIFHKSPKTTPAGNGSVSSNTQTPAVKANTSIVQTKTDASLGQYLADTSGNALYTYGADTTGVSNCTGSCLASWPIYKPASSSAALPTNLTVITRSDGSQQYAYKGMPLYTFTSDSSGQVTGDGVSDFSVAKP